MKSGLLSLFNLNIVANHCDLLDPVPLVIMPSVSS